jgi:hypothetical protein
MKRWGLFLLGAGIGVIVGVQVGGPATMPALVAVVLGLFLLALSARSGTSELVGDATATRTTAGGGATAPGAAADRPALKDLGSQVETILSLAEKQAADHVAGAKATAAEIVAQAHAEADRIKPE